MNKLIKKLNNVSREKKKALILLVFSIAIAFVLLSTPFSPWKTKAQACWRTTIHNTATPITGGPNTAIQILPINGKNILLGIGMSNSRTTFNGLNYWLKKDSRINPSFKFVNGAQIGMAAEEWALSEQEWDVKYGTTKKSPWENLFGSILPQQNVTRTQVQALFVMVTNKKPTTSPTENANIFKANVERIFTRAETEFPNLKIAYLAGNYFGGYDLNQDLTPEPHDYFENLKLQEIQDTWLGKALVKASSTMIWTDGEIPRWDGLYLDCKHMLSDGVHINIDGGLWLGNWLRNSLKSDPTTSGWMFSL